MFFCSLAFNNNTQDIVNLVISLVLITTSGRPTQRMRSLCNDLKRVIPNAVRINRGKLNMDGIFEKALEIGTNRILLVERRKGGPGRIKLYTSPFTTDSYSTLYLARVQTQAEMGRRTTIRSGLMTTVEKNALPHVKHLAIYFSKFLNAPLLGELPKEVSFKASTHFSNFRDIEIKISFTKPPMIREIGPTLIVRQLVNTYLGEDSFEQKA